MIGADSQAKVQDGSKRDIVFIHFLRGLAPLLVIFAHVPGLWLLERNETWSVFQFYKIAILGPLQISDGGGHFGVVVFFLISGYIISAVAVRETRTEFFVKRVLRIFPTLLAATAIAFVIVKLSEAFALGPIYSTDATKLIDFLKSAVMISWIFPSPRALSVAWSLMPELIFYLIVFVLLGLMKRAPIKATLVMILIYCALTFPMALSPYLAYLGYFTIYLPILIIGRIFYLEQRKQIEVRAAMALIILCAAMFVSVYSVRFPGELFNVGNGRIWNYIYALGLFYGLMVSDMKYVPRPIAYCADISYALYLVHLPVGIFVLNLLDGSPIPFGLRSFLAIAAAFAAAHVVHIVVERPAQQWARRILRRGPPLAVTQTSVTPAG
ncbi:acyltransferase [Kaistia geumhonensis]|uniref:Peptidoglycan/LPS O-acetylase OafA/YrhL n=1 Tax=Kaistia geumhonensis TaxID=410839 RepID=A0ABU0M3L7_9HYPH|nr:acyltransferase [Kaistia geumhonensis]MCX5479235.1 acyltransferase [Kaistia geumhonensis]MDQ0515544.1 peptidoglycan/LPS O-acetylase OafA/YrhL [Kaistia geumhonensis]